MTHPSMSAEPYHLTIARKYVGTKEFKGGSHNPLILGWWKRIKRGGIKDDETPWCAAFVGGVLEEAGIVSTRFESAVGYLKWGLPVAKPVLGCVVVFTRTGGGHVGFVVGVDKDGNLMVLGGNQGDEVSIKPFARERAVGYRLPPGYRIPMPLPELPLLASDGRLSANEA